jgi:hypothetical protein
MKDVVQGFGFSILDCGEMLGGWELGKPESREARKQERLGSG